MHRVTDNDFSQRIWCGLCALSFCLPFWLFSRHLKKNELYDLVKSKPLPASIHVGPKTNKATLTGLLLDPSLGYCCDCPPTPQCLEHDVSEGRMTLSQVGGPWWEAGEPWWETGEQTGEPQQETWEHWKGAWDFYWGRGLCQCCKHQKKIMIYIEDWWFQHDFHAKTQYFSLPHRLWSVLIRVSTISTDQHQDCWSMLNSSEQHWTELSSSDQSFRFQWSSLI